MRLREQSKILIFGYLAFMVTSVQPTKAFAEETPLVCDIIFEDGQAATWDFSIDLDGKKLIGLWGKENELLVTNKHVEAWVKQSTCLGHSSKVVVCFPKMIAIDRRTLKAFGTLGNSGDDEESRHFSGTCAVGHLTNQF